MYGVSGVEVLLSFSFVGVDRLIDILLDSCFLVLSANYLFCIVLESEMSGYRAEALELCKVLQKGAFRSGIEAAGQVILLSCF